MTRVFISHPLQDNVPIRRGQNRELLERLQREHPDVLFISPLLLFDYLDEDDEDARDDILATCCDLIEFICDEVWIFGNSEGCRIEREFAESIGIPIKDFAKFAAENSCF